MCWNLVAITHLQIINRQVIFQATNSFINYPFSFMLFSGSNFNLQFGAFYIVALLGLQIYPISETPVSRTPLTTVILRISQQPPLASSPFGRSCESPPLHSKTAAWKPRPLGITPLSENNGDIRVE